MEEAVWVVLDMDIVLGLALGSGLGHGLESVQESDLVLGQEPGWEFDQELAQEFDQDMEVGRCQVTRDSLGRDQVPALHHSHQVSGCTVSGTPLFHEWGTFQGWIHQTSSVRYHSSTVFWSTAASFGWHSAR